MGTQNVEIIWKLPQGIWTIVPKVVINKRKTTIEMITTFDFWKA